MAERTAVDTIKGYFYQFDYTIEQLLQQTSDSDVITVEGIEDVDLRTATQEIAIQCKYYSKTEYNHSVIAEPIRLMLNHFAEVKKGVRAKIQYRLRGHYKSGQSKLTLPLDVSALKSNFLTYTRDKKKHEHHNELNLSDTDLTEFIDVLEIDVFAKNFDEQYKQILIELKKAFSCSDFQAEYFYYNNALGVTRDLTTKPTISERTITKREFLERINTSKLLFNEWFITLKGEKAHFQRLKSELFTHLNVSPFERIFLIEIEIAEYKRYELKDLLFLISKKWSKLSKLEPKPFCPYVYIHGINPLELVEVKKELVSEGFIIIDGYDFKGAEFSTTSITKRPDYSNQIKLKILDDLEFIDSTISAITRTKEIYQFYISKTFFSSTNPSLKHIQIQVRSLDNIKNII